MPTKKTYETFADLVEHDYRPKTDADRVEAKRDVEALIRHAVDMIEPGQRTTKGAVRYLQACIDSLDKRLSEGVSSILHNSKLQELEGTWRGMHHLVDNTQTGKRLKIRVLNSTKEEIGTELKYAVDFRQSALFTKIYQQEYGMFGGHPYGVLVGDYQWSHESADVNILKGIAKVAAASHAPFISGVSPEMFGKESLTELDQIRDLEATFEDEKYAVWKGFRESEDSRYVALTMPRIMSRLPYGPKTNPVRSFAYDEGVNGTKHSDYTWSNSAYAYVTKMTNAFHQFSWCTAIRGVQGGGLLEDLPAHTFQTPAGETKIYCPTEIPVVETREQELEKLGFIALQHEKGRDRAVIMSGASVHQPKEYDKPNATANEQLSSKIPYLMASNRFAHYLKSIIRDWVGGFYERDELQSKLNTWIAQYVLLEGKGQALKSKYPLKQAEIRVESVPGRSGWYQAVAYLRPHFQLEGVDLSLRMVAELPKPTK